MSPLRVSEPPPRGPDRVFHALRPSGGVVSCVALGLPGHPPKGVVSRYPPRGVLRDRSRPVPGSCRGVVSPLSGGFPHRRNGRKEYPLRIHQMWDSRHWLVDRQTATDRRLMIKITLSPKGRERWTLDRAASDGDPKAPMPASPGPVVLQKNKNNKGARSIDRAILKIV